jgi:hypothetical protein
MFFLRGVPKSSPREILWGRLEKYWKRSIGSASQFIRRNRIEHEGEIESITDYLNPSNHRVELGPTPERTLRLHAVADMGRHSHASRVIPLLAYAAAYDASSLVRRAAVERLSGFHDTALIHFLRLAGLHETDREIKRLYVVALEKYRGQRHAVPKPKASRPRAKTVPSVRRESTRLRDDDITPWLRRKS